VSHTADVPAIGGDWSPTEKKKYQWHTSSN